MMTVVNIMWLVSEVCDFYYKPAFTVEITPFVECQREETTNLPVCPSKAENGEPSEPQVLRG